MAKPINLSNPVAATRAHLRLSQEDFAAHVGLGVSAIKQIESGQRKISPRTAEIIALRVAVPTNALLMDRWTEEDRINYRPKVAANFGGMEEMDVLRLLPKILALYYSMCTRGVDPRFGLMAIDREIRETAKRWGVDSDDLGSAELDIQVALMGVRGDRQGIDTPVLSELLKTMEAKMSDCGPRIRAVNACDKFNERFQKAMIAGIWDQFMSETISRASKKKPTGKGAVATKIDQLPAPKRRFL